MDRRRILKSAAVALSAAAATSPTSAQRLGRPFVLVAGAFSGGWLWARTADLLRAGGHRVFTCTLTGMGDRAHLLSKDISMDTFVDDVVSQLVTEELSDAVLVGSSFGGIPVSGAVDRVPERVAQVVFLDAVLVEPGKSAFDALPAEVVAARRRLAEESSGGLSLPPPPPSAYAALGISEAADVAWCQRRFTPHPIRTYETPLHVKRAIGAGKPCTYVSCLRPNFTPVEPSRAWARKQTDWRWIELAAGHLPMVTAPAELSRVLLEIAAR